MILVFVNEPVRALIETGGLSLRAQNFDNGIKFFPLKVLNNDVSEVCRNAPQNALLYLKACDAKQRRRIAQRTVWEFSFTTICVKSVHSLNFIEAEEARGYDNASFWSILRVSFSKEIWAGVTTQKMLFQ